MVYSSQKVTLSTILVFSAQSMRYQSIVLLSTVLLRGALLLLLILLVLGLAIYTTSLPSASTPLSVFRSYCMGELSPILNQLCWSVCTGKSSAQFRILPLDVLVQPYKPLWTSLAFTLIRQREVHSFSPLPPDSLPHKVLEARLACSPMLTFVVAEFSLPSLYVHLAGSWGKLAWKRHIKKIVMLASEHMVFLDDCDHVPLSLHPVHLGKPIDHWHITCGLPVLTRLNNFCVWLLVASDGLEVDASRLCRCRNPLFNQHNTTCKLCHQEPEDSLHGVQSFLPPENTCSGLTLLSLNISRACLARVLLLWS